MTEYLVLDPGKPYKQDSWAEEKDTKGRVIRPSRPARDDVEVAVRLDRQFRATLRLPASDVGPGKRQASLAAAATRYALGQEIAPGVQVVEVEQKFTEARPATTMPEKRDAQGNVIQAEVFGPATPERLEWSFTLRLNGLHLVKVSMTEAEMQNISWRQLLAQKAASPEIFTI